MAEPLIVVGAGGFGRETIDVVEAVNAAGVEPGWHLLGVVDDGPSDANLERLERRGIDFLGGTEVPLEEHQSVHYVVGIGNPGVRRTIADRYDAAGLPAATLIHPAATLGSGVEVGEGTVICAGARVTTNITLGRHVHLNPNVTVGHDTTLADFVSMNPASSVSGDCVIQDGVLIGVGAVVLNGLSVGSGVTIGGSACVVKDVAAGLVMVGVPAEPLMQRDIEGEVP
jgi:sugar O-acyltransferase (sialic acid O-acetyltransferase NeuD family)